MTSKKKKSKRRRTTRKRNRKRSSRDPLSIQISVKARIPKGKTISKRVVQEAIQFRARTGKNPKGMKLKIVAWRNPVRKNHKLENWRSGSQAAAWRTLRRPLLRIRVGAFTIRSSK
jgi:hypothetical protein